MEYKRRMADDLLQRKLKGKGAVLIQGAKWCGKTTTAEQIAKSVIYMDDPQHKSMYLQLAEMNIHRLLSGDTPHLIDEWQLAPQIWDAVRYEVDHRDDLGQFILTGSAVPADKSQIFHSGTGRFSWLTMRPMSLWESGDSTGEVSLSGLFEGQTIIDGYTKQELNDIAFLVCRGGWPRAVTMERTVALDQAKDYVDGVAESDISRVDGVQRNPDTARRLLRSYARHQGAQATVGTIKADMSSGDSIAISEKTITQYINALQQIFVVEDSAAWNPNLRSKTAIRTASTRYFVDPSIAAAALGLGPNDLMNDLETMGLMFETLCVRDLRVYAELLDGQVYHYRDKNGLECDAVVHLRNGSYGLIEVKLGGESLISDGVKTLNELAKNIDTTKMKAPAFKMILTATGNYAYRVKDQDVVVVPIGCLKP
jgi:predicted AAA+ superfamily ATPase